DTERPSAYGRSPTTTEGAPVARPIAFAAVTVGAMAIAIAANGTAPSAAGLSASRTVTLFEAQTGGTFQFIDQPPRSPVSNSDSPRARFSTGDQAYWTGVILDRSGGKPIGRVFGAETVMRGTRFPNVTNMI